jgi:dTDP-4-amino-4,6-dideoxygalactose transaminase
MASDSGAWSISLSDIDYGAEEERAVLEVLRSKWLSMGARTAEFEARFARTVGARHAVAVSNGTAALHLALLAAGVGHDDEVIVPALTFVATANAVLYCGATPVFGDIRGTEDLLLDPDDVAGKIGPRTRAVIPVHYGGYACDMDAIGQLAEGQGLRIVEDGAHAPGSSFLGRPIGSIGDATCFSFFSNKNLVTGEGGMVTTDDDEIAAFIRSRRSHGMTALSYDKHRGHAFSYDVIGTGYNYRLTEIEAVLGMAQLDKLERNNARRRELLASYRERLSSVRGLTVPFPGRDGESSCHIFVVVLPEGADRDAIQGSLKERGIQTSIHYPPLHRFTSFRDRFPATVPKLDRLSGRLLTLPLHPLMSEDDVDRVCASLRESL